jgi:hypothetical protein
VETEKMQGEVPETNHNRKVYSLLSLLPFPPHLFAAKECADGRRGEGSNIDCHLNTFIVFYFRNTDKLR